MRNGRASLRAWTSLILGLASPVGCVLTGIPAILVGLGALREINQSEGKLRGRSPAVVGIVLGSLSVLGLLLSPVPVVLMSLTGNSQRAHCQMNLARIGQAAAKYHGQFDCFPPATVANVRLPPEERLSWLALSLPFPSIAQNSLYDRLDLSRAWDDPENLSAVATRIPTYLCPDSVGVIPPDAVGSTTYVGLAGVGLDAARLPADAPRAGMFGNDRRVSIVDVRAGTSQTMMATETAHSPGPWAAGGHATVRGVDPDERPFLGRGRPFGGLHVGGANILFADGAVHFVTDEIEPRVFLSQLTLAADPVVAGAP